MTGAPSSAVVPHGLNFTSVFTFVAAELRHRGGRVLGKIVFTAVGALKFIVIILDFPSGTSEHLFKRESRRGGR